MRLFAKLNLGNPGHAVLLLLITTDLAFLVLFALLALGVVSDRGFLLTYDRSYAEVFQYVKQFWLILMLVSIYVRVKNVLYLCLASLFSFLLLDDYASFHEQWGEQLGQWLNFRPMLMLQPYDFGELVVLLSYAAIAGPLLLYGFRTATKDTKRFLWEVICLLFALGVFAVGLDVLHALSLPELISNTIGACEDGGEMIVVSLLVWRTLEYFLACHHHPAGEQAA